MKEQELFRRMILVAAVMLISAFLQMFQPYFIYWKPEFFNQPWRWWTAHWVHVGWVHYLLNMLAFIFLPFMFPHLQNRFLIIMMLCLPPLMSFSFYYVYPDIEVYAGLSGVMHGLYAAVALFFLQFNQERKFALLVLGLVWLKIIWENTFGSLETAELIGSPVLVEAHFVGAIWGSLLAMLWLIFIQLKKNLDKGEN